MGCITCFSSKISITVILNQVKNLTEKMNNIPVTIFNIDLKVLYLYLKKSDLMNTFNQNFWNFTSIFFYFGFIVLVGYTLQANGYDIREISTRDLIILILATYRLTRIVVFEKIFKFARDFIKNNSRYYFFSTIQFIVTCPWCTGVWMVMVIIVFFYLIPFGYLLAYALAVAGVASFIVQAANLMGLQLEEKQGEKYRK
jgi:hypothetical protein